MKLLHRLASVFDWILRRDRAEARLDDEMQALVEIAAAEKMRDGMSADEARRQARIELGGVEQLKEEVRAGRHGHLLDEVGRDVRYAGRMFVRHPGFTAVVVITLALGIGANTAIFSLIDALMLRSLPVPHPEELLLVNLRERGQENVSGGETFSYAILRALDEQRDVFSGVAGFTNMGLDVASGGTVTRMPGALVTGSFYDTLGVTPAAGRLLSKTDDVNGAPLVAVISDAFWARQFARSPAALGQTIQANGVSIAIVGVTPHGFSGAHVGAAPDLTMAASTLPRLRPSMAAMMGPGNFWLRALARPRSGLSGSAAAARLNAIWPALSDSVIAPHWPAWQRDAMAKSTFVLESGATGWTGLREQYQRPLYVLMAAVALVLLIACANIASLWLARASARRREIAVRLAIGAGRRRIVRQLLVESTMLSAAGAAVGIGLAWLGSRFLVDLISDGSSDLVFDLAPNWRVLGFAASVAIATGMMFGLAPLRHTSEDAVGGLRQDQRTTTRRSRLQPVLVTAQIALSLVLLAGAGLFVRTFTNLRHVDSGFVPGGVFVVSLPRDTSPSAEELAEVVRAVPGVTIATVTTHTPLDNAAWTEPIVPAGTPIPERDNARMVAVDPRFFETMQIPMAAGRAFTEADSRAPVVVINERYAAREFKGENPVGRHLVTKFKDNVLDLEIIGVARNTIFSGLRRGATATVYLPFARFGDVVEPTLAFRVNGEGGRVAGAVHTALQQKLPSTLISVRAIDAQVSGSIVRERMMATLAGAFGVLALALASIGLYGLLAYNVAQRSREIGIRMALGSRVSQVVGLVLVKGGWLVLMGLVLGLPAAWIASRSVQSMLFGVTPTDPLVIGGAIGVLVLSALLAAWLPARRAARVDPLVALRSE